jgi:RNA-directed DNA polymerase
MKRKGNFYNEIHTLKNLNKAYLKVRKNKRYKKEVLELSFFLEENLFQLKDELEKETYEHGKYRVFVVEDSKKREIKAPQVRDRIVHHALYNLIYDTFVRTFYHNSYACIKGKGNHLATDDLRRKLKGRKDDYFLKADVSQYFKSVNRSFLFSLISKKIKDKQVLHLIKKILLSNEDGIPIGNLTSQLFANVYLNELDQFVKRTLKADCYFRYMDDFVLVLKTKKEVLEAKENIEYFLKGKLDLDLNEKATNVYPISAGISFLGYITYENYILHKRKTFSKMMKKVWGRSKKEVLDTAKAYLKKTRDYYFLREELKQAFT